MEYTEKAGVEVQSCFIRKILLAVPSAPLSLTKDKLPNEATCRPPLRTRRGRFAQQTGGGYSIFNA